VTSRVKLHVAYLAARDLAKGQVSTRGCHADSRRGSASWPFFPETPFSLSPEFTRILVTCQVGLELVREQLLRLRALWQQRGQAQQPPPPRPLRLERDLPDAVPPEAWERALGKIVTGQPGDDSLSQQLAQDPGVKIIEGLIHEFRASMIVGILRLTSRLLILALGPSVFCTLLKGYWAKVPPQLYGVLEAEAFARYLEELNLKVPHLAKLLEFERAVTATLTDDQTRIVTFDFDPIPLLRALSEGRLPDAPAQAGRFEIELTAEGPQSVSGLDKMALEQAFPYH
jgi:uncharacterized protein